MRRRGRILLTVAAAIVVFAGAVFLLYTKELGELREVISRGSQLADTDAGPIEYVEAGEGAPLLSIHGAGGGYDQGLANVSDLVEDGFRIIAPSRFGYLRTPVPPDASSAAQADAHAALLSRLNLPKVVALGISAGARSATELALRHPEKVAALILIVPALYAPGSPVTVEDSAGSRFALRVVNSGGDFIWWAAEKIAPSILIRFMGVEPELVAAAPRAEQDRVMSIVRSVQPLSLRFPGIRIDSTVNVTELPLERIRVPTLIVSARDDLFNTLPSAEFTASKIPGARLVRYETGGHLMVGRRGEVHNEIRAFLAGAGLLPAARK